MKLFITNLAIALVVLVTPSCSQKKDKQSEKHPIVNESQESYKDNSGNYVSQSYDKRNEGYDWVAVMVDQTAKDKIQISIRSRADKKKPSCTFDAVAEKINETTFQIQIEESIVMFEFQNNLISISTKEFDNRFVLMYFCSGGGSIMGDYQKSNEALDMSQMDSKPFSNMIENGKILRDEN